MATHSSTLAWKIPWMEEPGRLQSMGSQRVGHDWGTSLSFSIVPFGEGNGNPLQFLPGESHGQRGLVGYSLWGCKELDMTKQLTHTHTHTYIYIYVETHACITDTRVDKINLFYEYIILMSLNASKVNNIILYFFHLTLYQLRGSSSVMLWKEERQKLTLFCTIYPQSILQGDSHK